MNAAVDELRCTFCRPRLFSWYYDVLLPQNLVLVMDLDRMYISPSAPVSTHALYWQNYSLRRSVTLRLSVDIRLHLEDYISSLVIFLSKVPGGPIAVPDLDLMES